MKLGKSKGITPVIAIVLLLLITVGAVGVVYTQFNELVQGNNAQERAGQLQDVQNAEYSIIGVNKTGSDTYGISLKNTGDVTLDLENRSTLQVGVNGDAPVASEVRGNQCGDEFGRLTPGSTEFCDTGVSWNSGYEDDGIDTVFQLQVGQTVKAEYTCTETGTSDYC
ncbi:archaellin/type IV pilin N-terminal domain-containing protein [Candidatus Nanohalococcus occultus]|uniref:Archaeal Type IV pilin N-terminal domain-containing protein n=1 Tax=Candidatus Nanohalococcus occultus TaxID=2978047 RepID=A0ABY8CF40_9ARCH|nr:hypothetical protein SVXNc_0825 [Candidatus Nanohaloarchaeota archaeon SVXNc]